MIVHAFTLDVLTHVSSVIVSSNLKVLRKGLGVLSGI